MFNFKIVITPKYSGNAQVPLAENPQWKIISLKNNEH